MFTQSGLVEIDGSATSFIFTLQEFAAELVNLVDAMARICAAERARGPCCLQPWYKRWPAHLLARVPWRHSLHKPRRTTTASASTSGYGTLPTANVDNRKSQRSLSEYFYSALPSSRTRIAAHFPKVRPHAPNTMSTPPTAALSFYGRAKQFLWRLGGRVRESDIKYAVKAGMATAMLAAPAFFEVTRPTFMEYRGEWALISFFVVLSPTIGAVRLLILLQMKMQLLM